MSNSAVTPLVTEDDRFWYVQSTGCTHQSRHWVGRRPHQNTKRALFWQLVEDSSLSPEEKEDVKDLYQPSAELPSPTPLLNALPQFSSFPAEIWVNIVQRLGQNRVVDIAGLLNPAEYGAPVWGRTLMRPIRHQTAVQLCKAIKSEFSKVQTEAGTVVTRRVRDDDGILLPHPTAWDVNRGIWEIRLPLGVISPNDTLLYRQGMDIAINTTMPYRLQESLGEWDIAASGDSAAIGEPLSTSALGCQAVAVDWQHALNAMNIEPQITSHPDQPEQQALNREWEFLSSLEDVHTLYVIFSEEIRISVPLRHSPGNGNFTPTPTYSPLQEVVDLYDYARIADLVRLDEPTRPNFWRVSSAANSTLGACIDCRREYWDDDTQWRVQQIWLWLHSRGLSIHELNTIFNDHDKFDPDHPWVRDILSRRPQIRPALLFSFYPTVQGDRDYFHRQMTGDLPVDRD